LTVVKLKFCHHSTAHFFICSFVLATSGAIEGGYLQPERTPEGGGGLRDSPHNLKLPMPRIELGQNKRAHVVCEWSVRTQQGLAYLLSRAQHNCERVI